MAFTYRSMSASKKEDKPQIKLKTFDCPNCGASITHYIPGKTTQIVCASCGSVIDPSGEIPSLLARYNAGLKVKPIIPLGAKGHLRGRDYLCIGYVVRKDVQWHFTWEEYLLFHPMVGYRWLARSDGHWSYITPCKGQPKSTLNGYSYERKGFRLFHKGTAEVVEVCGEFYWEIRIRDRSQVEDYIAPPEILSLESTKDEKTWSIGEYIPKEDIEKAFKLSLGAPNGIAPHQPSPYKHGFGKYFLYSFAMWLVLLFIHIMATGAISNRVVFYEAFEFKKSDTPPSLESPTKVSQISEPFEISGSPQNLLFEVASNVDNQWGEVTSSLINEANGETIDVTNPVSYYRGYDGGESWSEGSQEDRRVLSNVPDGNYRLRVQADSDKDMLYSVKLVRGTVGYSNFMMASFFFIAWPICTLLMIFYHERQRWQDSDYAPGFYATQHGGED